MDYRKSIGLAYLVLIVLAPASFADAVSDAETCFKGCMTTAEAGQGKGLREQCVAECSESVENPGSLKYEAANKKSVEITSIKATNYKLND